MRQQHSEACRGNEAKVVVRRSGTRLQLSVSDNGKGLRRRNDTEVRKGGFGLVNISERVQLFAGKLEIQSVPLKGATITSTSILTGSAMTDEIRVAIAEITPFYAKGYARYSKQIRT